MDVPVAAAGPWLVLGAVVGLLLATVVGLLAVAARRPRRRGAGTTGTHLPVAPPAGEGWAEDDLPGFLANPPGWTPDRRRPVPVPPLPPFAPPSGEAPPERPVTPRPGVPGDSPVQAGPVLVGPVLVALAASAVLLVGAAAATAALTAGRTPDRSAGSAPGPTVPATRQTTPGPTVPTTRHTTAGPAAAGPTTSEPPAVPAWPVPDLPAAPVEPGPDDPGAGLMATRSVPIGADGALARLTFGGIVLERHAVGVTVTYPGVSVTAAGLPGGPALAHVRLPTWNCLTDAAPADPLAAGCLRTPTEYADLPSPALSVTRDGDALRLGGRFPTYVRPTGSPPRWTGRVYPLTVTATAESGAVDGVLHVGGGRVATVPDRRLSSLRLGR